MRSLTSETGGGDPETSWEFPTCILLLLVKLGYDLYTKLTFKGAEVMQYAILSFRSVAALKHSGQNGGQMYYSTTLVGYINQLLIGWKRYPTVVTD